MTARACESCMIVGVRSLEHSNPRKQGHFRMHEAGRIVWPDSLRLDSPHIVIVMNAEYSARFAA